MSTQDNIAAQQAFGEAVNSADLGALDDLVSPDCVDHEPAPSQGCAAPGYRRFFAQMSTAFPDQHIEVEHLTAAENVVAFAYTLTGTHLGPLQRHGATGKSVKIRALQISRFSGGKMVERWGSSDEMGMMTQLGLARA